MVFSVPERVGGRDDGGVTEEQVQQDTNSRHRQPIFTVLTSGANGVERARIRCARRILQRSAQRVARRRCTQREREQDAPVIIWPGSIGRNEHGRQRLHNEPTKSAHQELHEETRKIFDMSHDHLKPSHTHKPECQRI